MAKVGDRMAKKTARTPDAGRQTGKNR